MGIIELLFLPIALSMDAFAVAVCKGLAVNKVKAKNLFITGLWFGGFQALMPLLGYLFGSLFEGYVKKFDHYIAFVLLCAIGVNMIKESFSKEEDSANCDFGFKTMFVMAVATSIDALAAGIALAMDPKISTTISLLTILLIGITTFTLSALGVKIGNIYGTKYKSKAELAGGIILIILGLKILVEHLLEEFGVIGA